jgi:uncharacterized protein YaaR (DUF327 family)
MKISREILLNKTASKGYAGKESAHFSSIMHSATQTFQDGALQPLLTAISEQAERIATFRSLQDVTKFKQMIQQYLRQVMEQGLKLDERYSFQTRSSAITIQQVDEKLIELTDLLLVQEKKTVDILGVIGEIKGLLINVYT